MEPLESDHKSFINIIEVYMYSFGEGSRFFELIDTYPQTSYDEYNF